MQSITDNFIVYLRDYLDTGVFVNKNNGTYISAYSKVIDLADVDDYGKRMYNFYVDTIRQYANHVYKSSLHNKVGQSLLNELVRRWDNHKILVY